MQQQTIFEILIVSPFFSNYLKATWPYSFFTTTLCELTRTTYQIPFSSYRHSKLRFSPQILKVISEDPCFTVFITKFHEKVPCTWLKLEPCTTFRFGAGLWGSFFPVRSRWWFLIFTRWFFWKYRPFSCQAQKLKMLFQLWSWLPHFTWCTWLCICFIFNWNRFFRTKVLA